MKSIYLANNQSQIDYVYSDEIMDKLINVALPRVRDFRGVSGKAFQTASLYPAVDVVALPEILICDGKILSGPDIELGVYEGIILNVALQTFKQKARGDLHQFSQLFSAVHRLFASLLLEVVEEFRNIAAQTDV